MVVDIVLEAGATGWATVQGSSQEDTYSKDTHMKTVSVTRDKTSHHDNGGRGLAKHSGTCDWSS